MPETRFNLVTFTPDDDRDVNLMLTLEGDFVITAGLAPNVTAAVAPHTEYAKLGNNPRRRGTLRFWYSQAPGGEPDVEYDGMRIVEVTPTVVGVVRGGKKPQIVEYTLHLADFRDRLVPPRGGRVRLGVVNPTVSDAAIAEFDGSGKPLPAPEPRGTRDLLTYCLDRTGISYASVPESLDDVAPPRDLQWFGSFAAAELGRLLEHTDTIFCPTRSGTGRIVRAGEGDAPTGIPADRRVADVLMPQTDQRGKIVIFTSAPAAAVETREISGPGAATWEFVIQDKDGRWREVNDPQLKDQNLIDKNGPTATVRSKGANISAEHRDDVRRQLYHFIRLANVSWKPQANTILRRQVTPELKATEIVVQAKRARATAGLWSNGAGNVRCGATFLNSGQNVIHVQELLGKLKDGVGTTSDPEADFEPLAAGELLVKLTLESTVEFKWPGSDKPHQVPEYYTAGFKRDPGGAVVALAEPELSREVDSPDEDTVFISRPELRLVREYKTGATGQQPATNRADLDKRAKALATRYLKAKEEDAPRMIQVKGFYGIDLDARVSEVRISQRDVLTTIRVEAMWTPMAGQDLGELSRPSRGEAYPQQGRTLGEGLALGSAGVVQPSVPIAPPAPPVTADLSFPARIKGGERVGEPGAAGRPYRWQYAFQEVVKVGVGYDGEWANKPSGREGGAFNWIEQINGGAGGMGNGITTAHLVGTGLELQACPSGVIVRMHTVRVAAKAADPNANPPTKAVPETTEFWFSYENGVDGPCEESP